MLLWTYPCLVSEVLALRITEKQLLRLPAFKDVIALSAIHVCFLLKKSSKFWAR